MEIPKPFVLPKLPYGYRDLEPYISEKQPTKHHTKHHRAYVNGCNRILQKLNLDVFEHAYYLDYENNRVEKRADPS